MMKIKRKHLMGAVLFLGAFLIVYSLARYFLKFEVPEKVEKYIMDVVIIGALGLFMYNRKLAKDERLAKEAAAEAERRAAEEPEEEAELDETLPHWERYKKADPSEDADR